MGYQVFQIQPHILTPAHDKRSTKAKLAGPHTTL